MADEIIIDKDKDVISVQDKYLYYLLNGGDFNTLPIPVNRQDKYLYLLCLKRSTIEEINVSEWLYGNGDPSTAPTPIGADKDYYIDRTTGDIYRKEGEEWKNIQLNIKGDQGIQGVKGDKGDPFAVAKTYASVQAMNQGFATDEVKEGQFVIITNDVNNEENAQLYVKGASAYTFVTDMSGATGIKGDKGERGEQGIQGIQGIPGVQGEKGDTGSQGIQGIQGVPGERGLQGETGAKGDKGDKGDTGVGIKAIDVVPSTVDGGDNTITITTTDNKQTVFKIKNGSKGDKGDTGATGQAGASGVSTSGNDGADGVDGKTWKPTVTQDGQLSWTIDDSDTPPVTVNIKGATGSAGKNGLDGSKWYVGDDTSEVTSPKSGDFFLKSDGSVWTYNTDKWEATNISLKGAKGDTGAKGEQGDPGVTTTTSGQAVQGAKGDKGDTWRPSVDVNTGQLTWTLDTSPTDTNAPAPVNIKGANGTNGKNGTVWFSGDTEPNANNNLTTAVQGDFYLQKDGTVWKKNATTWEKTTISLKGEKGEQGEAGVSTGGNGQVTTVKGEKGDQGEPGDTWKPSVDTNGNLSWTKDSSDTAPQQVNIKGANGQNGKNGTTWYSGANAPTTVNGAVEGDFYLQGDGKVWRLQGTQWVDTQISLKGEKGEQGIQGETGASGSAGATTQGQAGADGQDGADGKTFRPSIANNQITWTASDDTSNVNFSIPQEIVMSDTEPSGQVTNNVWIDTSGNTTT